NWAPPNTCSPNRPRTKETTAMTKSNEITRKLENQAPHLDYYPHWLDNLADDVILQGAVFNGELRGAEQVGKMLSFARSLYAFQDFRFYGMRGDLFLEDYL